MRRAGLAAVLPIIAAGLLAGGQPAAAATDYPALVRAMSAAVAAKYYDPHLHGADWPALTRRYEREARAVRTDAEFLKLADQMMAALKSSHVDVLPPSRDVGGRGPAIKTRSLDRPDVVAEVSDLSDARAKGVRPGEVVLNPAALRGQIGSEAEVKLLDCEGGERLVRVRREAAFWPPPEPAFRRWRLRTGPHTTLGYLRVDAFEDDGAELADQAMADLGDTDGLVIDLRGNHGGNASAVRLASYFTRAAGPAVILLGREHLQALGRTPTPQDALKAPRVERTYTTDAVWAALKANGGAISIWTEDVGAKRYQKPVAVLIGPETASAAEGFAWIMRLRSPAVFVGERSAGELLSAGRTDIGQGWTVVIPEAGVWAPNGADYGDKAIAPQVEVPLTRADLCAGRDRQLETALSLVSPKAR